MSVVVHLARMPVRLCVAAGKVAEGMYSTAGHSRQAKTFSTQIDLEAVSHGSVS